MLQYKNVTTIRTDNSSPRSKGPEKTSKREKFVRHLMSQNYVLTKLYRIQQFQSMLIYEG